MRRLPGIPALALVGILASDAGANPNHGSGAVAIPSYIGVASASKAEAPLRLETRLGYAYTRNVLTDSDTRHRGSGSVAFGWSPIPELDLVAKLHGLADQQLGLDSGSDASAAGLPSVLARWSTAATPSLRLGLAAEAWFPGRSAPSLVLSATSLDAHALATLSIGRASLTGSLGLRYDRSAELLPSDDRMVVPADLQTLTLSGQSAALLGVAASYPLGATTVLSELRWDLRDNQDASASPLRFAAGVRRALGAYSLGAYYQRNLTSVHASQVGPALAPHTPTTEVFVDLQIQFGAPTRSVRVASPTPTRAQPEEKALQVEPEAPRAAALRGTVVDDLGQPAEGVLVTITAGETTRTTRTDARGAYLVDKLPLGVLRISLTLEDFEPLQREVTLSAAGARLTSQLIPAAIPAELRGQVTTKRGAVVAATLTITPGNIQRTSEADGTFRLELQPGRYSVHIESPGYQSQTRSLEIRESSVSILNIEMKKASKRKRRRRR